MLSWQCKALTEEEKVAMIGSMRNASGNTRFASWLETWWSSEEQTDWKDGMPPGWDKTTVKATEANGRGAEGTAVDGLGQVQEYLRRRSDGDVSITGDSKAAALAAAADKSGYTPSWDDMFRMNRQQLEQIESKGASPSPLLSPSEAVAIVRRCERAAGVLSHGWLSPGMPDPAGARLRVVRKALQAYPHIQCLFWDYMCARFPVPDQTMPCTAEPLRSHALLSQSF